MMHVLEHILSDAPSVVQRDVSLASFNTFRFDYQAQFLALVDDLETLKRVVHWAHSHQLPITVLGGGSNLLIRDHVSGLVIVNQLRGKRLVSEDAEALRLSVAGGENWHDLVAYCVQQGWSGIENLALIPGTVGAAPVQNIGAYGVEVKDVIARVQVLEMDSGQLYWLRAEECGFSYRDSHFKGKWKGRYIITETELCLFKQPRLVLNYGGLKSQIHGEASLRTVFDAVCAVRRSKLPDPNDIANAGSFFKNPVVSVEEHAVLKQRFPDLVSFSFADGYKLAAGWMIDQAGWKGRQHKGVGVYEKQALVLVNHSEHQAASLLELESLIKESVFERYCVQLEREPVELPSVVTAKSHAKESVC